MTDDKKRKGDADMSPVTHDRDSSVEIVDFVPKKGRMAKRTERKATVKKVVGGSKKVQGAKDRGDSKSSRKASPAESDAEWDGGEDDEGDSEDGGGNVQQQHKRKKQKQKRNVRPFTTEGKLRFINHLETTKDWAIIKRDVLPRSKTQ